MRVTTLISGVALGILTGMYLADRRSLVHLQSKLHTVGNVVQDVVDKAKHKVVDVTENLMNMPEIASLLHKHIGKETANKEAYTLDQVKKWIERDPEIKKKVDDILRENGLAAMELSSEISSNRNETTSLPKTSSPHAKSLAKGQTAH